MKVVSTAEGFVGLVDPLCQWLFHRLMLDPIEYNRVVNTEKPDEREAESVQCRRASSGL